MKLRRLPDGAQRHGWEAGWRGKILDIEFPDESAAGDLCPGVSLEIEAPDRLYLGVVLERGAAHVSVAVEHYLELGQIEAIREVWG